MLYQDLYPHLHLLVSGGNSQIIYLRSWTDFEVIGATLDDAAGECFDKCGRMLGLPYPGGVYLSKIAGLTTENICNFPVGMKNSHDYNFSFSGLKTAVRYHLEKKKLKTGEYFVLEKKLTELEIQFLIDHSLEDILTFGADETGFDLEVMELIKNVCISAQSVIVESLTTKLTQAYKNLEVASIGLSGGVSANPLLRQKLQNQYGEKVMLAPRALTGDNAVMIGLAGILDWKNRE